MDDLISRADAIKALEKWENEYTWDDFSRYADEVVSPSDVIRNINSISTQEDK